MRLAPNGPIAANIISIGANARRPLQHPARPVGYQRVKSVLVHVLPLSAAIKA